MAANEKRLIDANAFAGCLERMTKTAYPNLFPGLLEAIDYVKDFPTVDAVEVVHGRWIELPSMAPEYKCSECGQSYEWWEVSEAHYCPNCGAKMDGERKNNVPSSK